MEQVGLGDVRRVHEGVSGLGVPLARIVLQLLADDPAARVENRKPRTDLLRKREQVELGADPAVVPPLGFGQPLQVLRQGLR